VTPGELFLAGIATCGVELVQVIAKATDVSIGAVRVEVTGEIDPDNPVRDDLTVFTSVRLAFELSGVSADQGRELVEGFKRR
jgi:uncharacterized OsmC-like protein